MRTFSLVLSGNFVSAAMLTQLPPELLEKIVGYLSKKDTKSLSVVATLCCRVCRNNIWRAPRLKKAISPCELVSLVHLPIEVVHTQDFNSDFSTGDFIEVLWKMTSLQLLHLDAPLLHCDLKSFQRLNVDLVVHSSALKTVQVHTLSVVNK